MVDKEILQQKIIVIEENIKKLEYLAALSEEEFLGKFYYIESAKHLLQVSIEAMLDVAHHIIARERYRSPQTYAEAFLILIENKVLPKEREKNYLQMAKFRNRVVHLYHEVDEKDIYKILKEGKEDFKEFVKALVQVYCN